MNFTMQPYSYLIIILFDLIAFNRTSQTFNIISLQLARSFQYSSIMIFLLSKRTYVCDVSRHSGTIENLGFGAVKIHISWQKNPLRLDWIML